MNFQNIAATYQPSIGFNFDQGFSQPARKFKNESKGLQLKYLLLRNRLHEFKKQHPSKWIRAETTSTPKNQREARRSKQYKPLLHPSRMGQCSQHEPRAPAERQPAKEIFNRVTRNNAFLHEEKIRTTCWWHQPSVDRRSYAAVSAEETCADPWRREVILAACPLQYYKIIAYVCTLHMRSSYHMAFLIFLYKVEGQFTTGL